MEGGRKTMIPLDTNILRFSKRASRVFGLIFERNRLGRVSKSRFGFLELLQALSFGNYKLVKRPVLSEAIHTFTAIIMKQHSVGAELRSISLKMANIQQGKSLREF